jgi:hypothetical protein
MFGLLNPALTPLKAKATLFVAGLVVTALAGMAATSWWLNRQLGSANTTIGELNVDIENVKAINLANLESWAIEKRGLVARIEIEKGLRSLADEVAMKAMEREKAYDQKLAAALRRLKESSNATDEVRAWSGQRVPDPVIDGMCRAARETVGEAAAACRSSLDQGSGSAGAPDSTVRGGATP